jgi:hypothetical protein
MNTTRTAELSNNQTFQTIKQTFKHSSVQPFFQNQFNHQNQINLRSKSAVNNQTLQTQNPEQKTQNTEQHYLSNAKRAGL